MYVSNLKYHTICNVMQYEKISSGSVLPQRIVLAIMGFFACFVSASIDMCISVAITEMVVPLNQTGNSTPSNDGFHRQIVSKYLKIKRALNLVCFLGCSQIQLDTTTTRLAFIVEFHWTCCYYYYWWFISSKIWRKVGIINWNLIIGCRFNCYRSCTCLRYEKNDITSYHRYQNKQQLTDQISENRTFEPMNHFIVGGFIAFIVLRTAMSCGTGVLFPSLTVQLAAWIPKTERTKLVSFVYSGFAVCIPCPA